MDVVYWNEFVADKEPPKGFTDPQPFGMLEIYRERLASGGAVLVFREDDGLLHHSADAYLGRDDEYDYRVRAEYLLMLAALYGRPALSEDAHVLIASWNHAATSMFLVTDTEKMLEWCAENVWAASDPVDIEGKPAAPSLLAGLFSLDENAATYVSVKELKAFLKAKFVKDGE